LKDLIKSKLITTITLGGSGNTTTDNRKESLNTCDAFYLLWDLRDDSSKSSDSFMADVRKLLPKLLELKSVLERSICCIEVVISNKSSWQSRGLEKVVHDMIKWMDTSCQFGCIYIGICDSVGGAPALEAILDYAKIIEDHNLHSSLILSKIIKLRVIALSATELLGHDPSREPDAVSGVYQAEYIHARTHDTTHDTAATIMNSNQRDNTANDDGIRGVINGDTGVTQGIFSDDLTLSQWAETVGLEHSKIPRDSNGQRGSNVKDMKGDSCRSAISLVVVVSVCVVAYLFQLQSRTIV
jgi:hypothetical protein